MWHVVASKRIFIFLGPFIKASFNWLGRIVNSLKIEKWCILKSEMKWDHSNNNEIFLHTPEGAPSSITSLPNQASYSHNNASTSSAAGTTQSNNVASGIGSLPGVNNGAPAEVDEQHSVQHGFYLYKVTNLSFYILFKSNEKNIAKVL